MSKNVTFAAALVAGLFASGAAMAVDAAGVVDVYHVNIPVGGGRSGCIQFAGGGLPNGWGCVYGGSAGLAEAINDLLRQAALLPVGNPSKTVECSGMIGTTTALLKYSRLNADPVISGDS